MSAIIANSLESLIAQLKNDPVELAQNYIADPTMLLQELLGSIHRYERMCSGDSRDEREQEARLTLDDMIMFRDEAIKVAAGLSF